MCHCSNMEVEWTLNKSHHTKLTLEKKILLQLLPGFELAKLSITSPALLPTSYPGSHFESTDRNNWASAAKLQGLCLQASAYFESCSPTCPTTDLLEFEFPGEFHECLLQLLALLGVLLLQVLNLCFGCLQLAK